MDTHIWMFHHYATPPTMNGLMRPYDFATQLKEHGYKSTIFTSSYLHYSGENLIKNNDKYIEHKYNEVPFIFVRTPQYKNNGILRVRNMIAFAINLIFVSKTLTKMKKKPDIIYASSPHPLTLIAGIIVARKLNIPCFCEVRDLWPESFVAYGIINKNSPLLRLLYIGERWIYKKADKLIFTMEGGKDYIIEKGWDKASGGPIDLDKVHHINNGVDLEAFDYNKEHFQIDDADLKDNESFKVIYVGSIRLVNNLGLLLDTAKILKERGESKIKFLIWGDGNELEALKQRVQQEGLTNVSFKGRVDKKYVPYITSCGQLNIVLGKSSPLYKYGGSLNKMFDYFASGKPTLFTFRLGYSLIERYDAGVELNAGNEDDIADALLYFARLSEERYKTYCANARIAANDFDFNVLTNKLAKILEDETI